MQALRDLFEKAKQLTYQNLLRWDSDGECVFSTIVNRDVKLTLRCEEEGEAHVFIVTDGNSRDVLPTLDEFGGGNDLAQFFKELEAMQAVNALDDIEAGSRLANVAKAMDDFGVKTKETTRDESEGNTDAD